MNLNFGHQCSTSSNWRHFNFTFLSIFFTEFSFNGWFAGGVHCKIEALPTQSNVQLQTRYSTSINGEQKSNWCNSNSLLIRILSHLVHGNASDPAVLLEDFLHISLHYLERVQVPNKNPVKINALTVFRALKFFNFFCRLTKSWPAIDGLRILTACLVAHLAHIHLHLFKFLLLPNCFSSFPLTELAISPEIWFAPFRCLSLPCLHRVLFSFLWLRTIPWPLFSIYSLCLCFFHENISLVICLACYSKSLTQLPFLLGSVSKKINVWLA